MTRWWVSEVERERETGQIDKTNRQDGRADKEMARQGRWKENEANRRTDRDRTD